MSSFAANSYLAYLRARGALTIDPAALQPYAALADDTTDPETYALTLSTCDNMAGILAIGHNGKVLIGHHFLFDMKTPFFAPASSDELIMLMGRHTVDNPVTIDPSLGLAIQVYLTFSCPLWNALASAPDGDAIAAITAPRNGRKEYSGGPRPLVPIPTWLATALMDTGTNKAANLCLVAIQVIYNFDIRATSSPTAAAALAQADDPADPNDPDQPDIDNEEKDDDEEEDDLIDVTPPPVTAQSILWRNPIFLWAVATSKIGGCHASIADSLPVKCWCATIRCQCFVLPSATTPAHTLGQAPTHVTPNPATLET
jgi:hypothetical protein